MACRIGDASLLKTRAAVIDPLRMPGPGAI